MFKLYSLTVRNMGLCIIMLLSILFLPVHAHEEETPLTDIVDAIKQYQDRDKYKGDVNLSLAGYQSSEAEFFPLDLGFSVRRDRYPDEIRANFSTSIIYQNGRLEESVNSALLNYDYNLHDWVEIYAFGERFSNSYLSIDERYEIGIGAKFQYIGPLFKKSAVKLQQTKKVWGNMIDTLNPTIRALTRSAGFDPDTSLNNGKDWSNFEKGYREKESRLEISLALSLFYEIEKASLETILPGETSATTFEIDQSPVYRGVFRPGIRYYFTPFISGYVLSYFKRKLAEEADWRNYTFASLRWRVSDGQEVSLNYTYEFDSRPPEIQGGKAAKTYKQLKFTISYSL